MKCWIDGKECQTRFDDDDFGILYAKDFFCKDCHTLVRNRKSLEFVLEEELDIEIKVKDFMIGEEEESLLVKNVNLLLELLKLAEEKRKKEISEISEETIQKAIGENEEIRAAKRFIEAQRQTLIILKDFNASELGVEIEGFIKKTEQKIESIKERICKELGVDEDTDGRVIAIKELTEMFTDLKKRSQKKSQ